MKKVKLLIQNILALLLGALVVLPVFFLFSNSFKTQEELLDSFLTLPKALHFENYVTSWNNMNYFRALNNTLTVTLLGVALIVVLCSMAAYKIGRSRSRWATILIIYFMLAMMLPFQTIMIPLMQICSALKLSASLLGYSIVATALLCPFTIYLYRGFYNQIPCDIEEAALIDGANTFQSFFYIVFPLLRPVSITVIIINVMNIWNDYILALLLLQKRDKLTLQMSVVQYNGRYNMEWHLTLATLAIVILPVVIFYLCMQNRIQSGMLAGSVKG